MIHKKKVLMRYMLTWLIIGSNLNGYSLVANVPKDIEDQTLLKSTTEEKSQDTVGAPTVVPSGWRQYTEKLLGQDVAAQFLWSFFMSPAAIVVGKERKSGSSDLLRVLQSAEINAFVQDETSKIKKLIQQKMRERVVRAAPMAEKILNVFTNQGHKQDDQ